jgi:hypothetical protein
MSGTGCRAAETTAVVDHDGVTVDAPDPAVIDVLFEGRWVWSFHSGRDTILARDARRAPWPAGLRPFLRGTGRVTVRARHTRDELFDGDVAFDDSAARVRIADHETSF